MMFGFLKSLFANEKKEIKELHLNELEAWFNQKSGSYYKESDEKREKTNNKITDSIKQTREIIGKLRAADLHNPNITLKEKQFMEGNREAYINRANLFLEKITLPEKIENISSFHVSFGDELNSFKKSTLKPYQILQHFFSHETNNILHSINIIEGFVKNLNELAEDEKITSVSNIKNKMAAIKNKEMLKENLKDNIAKKEKEEKGLNEEVKDNERNLNHLKKSKEFANYNKKIDRLAEVKGKIKEKENMLLVEFSVLEKAMKKFAKIVLENEDLINNYIRDPVNTLMDDRAFRILTILERLEGSIVNDSIELKDKKKSKSLKVINKLNKDFLEGFLSEYNKLFTEKEDLVKEINESNARKLFYEVEDKLNKNKENLNSVSKEMEEMKKELEKIDIQGMKKELEVSVRDVSGDVVVLL